jgi:hypothetical protein
MAIKVVCDACRKQFEAPEEYAGREATCPRCKAAVTIPDPKSEPQRVVVTGIKLSVENMMGLITIFWVASFLLALVIFGLFLLLSKLFGNVPL